MELVNDANLYLAAAGWFSGVEGNSFLMALTCWGGGGGVINRHSGPFHTVKHAVEQQVRGACGKTLEES